jgi:hypothetical protein
MKDPTRLLTKDGGLERSLLRAWQTRQPSDAARRRTLSAIEAGAVLAVGAAAATVAPKAVAATSPLVKWAGLAAGVLATAGAVGYAGYHGRSVAHTTAEIGAPEVAGASPRAAARVEPQHLAEPVASALDETPPAVAPSPAPVPRVGAVAPAPAPAVQQAKAVSPAPAASSLLEEVALLDDARRALGAGDAARASALVDGYEARFPAGSLVEEAAEVRIEALYRAGKRAQAGDLAAKFLAAHPSSIHARVIRSLQAAAISPSP